MEQYIPKDAVLAEIENLIKGAELYLKYNSDNDSLYEIYKHQKAMMLDLLNKVDAFEVKEVDLELNSFDATVCKICNTYLKEMDKDAIVKALEPYKDGDKVKVIIKAQKGELYDR